MYPDLFKGLNLRPEDFTAYDSPLVSFDGKIVISKGQIRLPIQTGPKVVEVDFIVVDAYSPYTIHNYYGQTLASYPRSRLFYSAPKGEIPI